MPGSCPGGQKKYFEHGYVAYQIDWDDEQNRMQVKCLPLGQTGDLGVRSNIMEFHLQFSQFQRFLYQTLFVFSQIRHKHIGPNFHSVKWVMPQE